MKVGWILMNIKDGRVRRRLHGLDVCWCSNRKVEARPGAGADGKGHCCLVRGAVQLAGSGDVAVMVRTGLMDVRSWWRMHGCCGWAILKVALAVSTVDRAGVCLRRGGWLRCVKGFNSGCFVVGGGRVVIGVCVAGL